MIEWMMEIKGKSVVQKKVMDSGNVQRKKHDNDVVWIIVECSIENYLEDY